MSNFNLESISRVNQCLLPTPLEPMKRLSAHIGDVEVYMKRDDLTGIALGGNKNRKLEYLLADALDKGSDAIITEGAVTSNHCLQTAAFSTKLGLECHLVLSDAHIGDKPQGNLLLDKILGAKIYRVSDSKERKNKIDAIAKDLIRMGKRPYVIPTGGSNEIGILGYVNFMKELAQQSKEIAVKFDYFIVPTGSTGTQAGILIGKKLFYPQIDVLGITAGDGRLEIITGIKHLISDFNKKWNVSIEVNNSEIKVLDQYYGEGYGVPNEKLISTIELVAQLEGIFLDPVYNGKAMVGLIDLVENKIIPDKSKILFLHSGGTPALFAYDTFFIEK